MDAAPLKAIPTRDRQRIILAAGAWRTTIAAADLPRWIALYAALRDRMAPRDTKGRITEPGPWYKFYAADVAAMEALQLRLRGEQP